MFKMAFLQVDYKEVIDEHKQLLKKVNKKIDFVLGNN